MSRPLPSRVRWIAYGAALLLTLAAVWWTSGQAEAPHAIAAANPATSTAERALPGMREFTAPAVPQSANAVQLGELAKRAHARPAKDPFGAKFWAQMEQERARRNAPPPAPVAPPPPQAPPLPYAYMGKLIEQGNVVVFLTRGDRNFRVRVGDSFDGTYRVEAIEDERIVLSYVPLGIRQTLSFDASALRTAESPPELTRAPPRRRATEEDD